MKTKINSILALVFTLCLFGFNNAKAQCSSYQVDNYLPCAVQINVIIDSGTQPTCMSCTSTTGIIIPASSGPASTYNIIVPGACSPACNIKVEVIKVGGVGVSNVVADILFDQNSDIPNTPCTSTGSHSISFASCIFTIN